MSATRLVQSPPLAPSSQEGWLTPAEGVDGVIRFVWRLHLDGRVTWTGAGQLHDRLNELREGLR